MKTLSDLLTELQNEQFAAPSRRTNICTLNDAVHLATLVLAADGSISDINFTAASLLGYEPHELTGCLLEDLLYYDKDELQEAKDALQHWLLLSEPRHNIHAIQAGIAFAPQDFFLRNRLAEPVRLQMGFHQTTLDTSIKVDDNTAMFSDAPNAAATQSRVMIWMLPDQSRLDSQRQLQQSLRTHAELHQLNDQLMLTQEQERKSLAQEMHDGVAQSLTMIKLTLDETARALDEGQLERARISLQSSTELTREALNDARRIAQELWPRSLEDLGLLPTIGACCRQFTQAQPQISISNDMFVREHDVPAHLKLDIYRVLQQCLRNVMQHAHAKAVRVTLRKTKEGLKLTVKDDGVGFDADALFYGPACLLGLGLRSMRERLQSHEGELSVQSSPGGGAVVTALWHIHTNRKPAKRKEALVEANRGTSSTSAASSASSATRKLK